MQVIKLKEAGFEEAALGLSLSFKTINSEDMNKISKGDYILADRIKDVVMPNLAHKGGGHNKFLESMYIWALVRANQAWWSQMDTYRIMTKQSTSTMHTLAKHKPTKEDFEPDTDIVMVTRFIDEWSILRKDIDTLRRALPQGYLATRQLCLSYKTLQNIYYQRNNHRSKDWKEFLNQITSQLDYPDFIIPNMNT